MQAFNFIFCYIVMIIIVNIYIECYKKLSNIEEKRKIQKTIVIMIVALLQTLNNYYVLGSLKILISFLILFSCFKILFKENGLNTLVKAIIIYIILITIDFLLSFIFLFFPVERMTDIGNLSIIKAIFSLLESLILLLIFNLRYTKKQLNKIINKYIFSMNILTLIVIFISLVAITIITSISAYTFNTRMLIVTVILSIIFLIFISIFIIQYIKTKNAEDKEKTLLDFMKKYEIFLDKDRMNRHEIINDLLILKTIKNKNTNEYDEIINEIIKKYKNNKVTYISNLHKLPSGLKGIIYYRLNNISNSKLKTTIQISKEVEKAFKQINEKEYYTICKIVGILLDNAIEESCTSNEKNLLIDIYCEKEKLIIYIENSCKNKVEINKINKKGFSTKGKNRGYGLFIINKILQQSYYLDLLQKYENNKFITELQVKIKKVK